MTDQTVPPGAPGIPPRWTSSAKSAVGTAAGAESRIWFTISHGILNEVYAPRLDTACIRDFGLIVTANDYFSEEKRDADHTVADDTVSTTMDVRAFAKRKHDAIATHASQVDNADLVTMDEGLFTLLFGIEYYQRAWSRDVTSGDETDLFGGL